jgi:hypothetical protein
MTTNPLQHKGPPNVAAARAQMGIIGDHIEHCRTLDAERAENALLRYVINAFREGCEDADAIANVACPEAP